MSFAEGASLTGSLFDVQPTAYMQAQQRGAASDAGQEPVSGAGASGYDFSKWGAQNINKYADDALFQDFNEGSGESLADKFARDKSLWQANAETFNGSEDERYRNAGVNDPRYQEALKTAASTPDKFDDLIAADPALLGRLNDRAFRRNDDADAYQFGPAYFASQLQREGKDTSFLSAEQKKAGEAWTDYMSNESQNARGDARHKASWMEPLGDLVSIFSVIAPVFGAAGTAAGAATEGASATTGGVLGTGLSTGSMIGDRMIGGAVTGAATSAATGGNPLTGAVTGSAGGAVGGFASTLEGGANFVGPTQGDTLNTSNLVNAAGSAGIAGLAGGNPLVAGASSLAGSATRNATGSGIAGRVVGTATGLLGSVLMGGSQSGTAAPVAGSSENSSRAANSNVNDFLHTLDTPRSQVRYTNVGLLNR